MKIVTESLNEGMLRHCGAEVGAGPSFPARTMGGWSLVELLVASALSMSLATLALRAFLAGSGMQAEVSAELRLQQGARYALHVLGRYVRMAGFPGCIGETPESSPMNPDRPPAPAYDPVAGWNTDRPHPRVAPDNDVIALWWSVAGCSADGPAELQPPPDAMEAQQGQGLRGSLFYIGRRGNNEESPPALFLRDLSSFDDSGPARELIEGLESMRIEYGMSGSAVFLPAHRVRNWREVRSVRIDLRLQSQLVQGLRRNFSHTLALRNHRGSFDVPQ